MSSKTFLGRGKVTGKIHWLGTLSCCVSVKKRKKRLLRNLKKRQHNATVSAGNEATVQLQKMPKPNKRPIMEQAEMVAAFLFARLLNCSASNVSQTLVYNQSARVKHKLRFRFYQ